MHFTTWQFASIESYNFRYEGKKEKPENYVWSKESKINSPFSVNHVRFRLFSYFSFWFFIFLGECLTRYNSFMAVSSPSFYFFSHFYVCSSIIVQPIHIFLMKKFSACIHEIKYSRRCPETCFLCLNELNYVSSAVDYRYEIIRCFMHCVNWFLFLNFFFLSSFLTLFNFQLFSHDLMYKKIYLFFQLYANFGCD